MVTQQLLFTILIFIELLLDVIMEIIILSIPMIPEIIGHKVKQMYLEVIFQSVMMLNMEIINMLLLENLLPEIIRILSLLVQME